QAAIAKYGRDGSYQKITHYGDEFIHDDELAWAACELFLATGDEKYEKELIGRFDPNGRDTKRWSWWRLYECYGCAIRSYAFAAKTKRLPENKLTRTFLRKCEDELIAGARDISRFATQTAYGTSFPDPDKAFASAGWYFPVDRSFDLAVASSLDHPQNNNPTPAFEEAIIGNLNYELGCNPGNISFLSGLGKKRLFETVNQYALNDRRVLPPSGIPVGSIQGGFPYLENYKKELGQLTFPSDGSKTNPTPFYDRTGDTFNTSAEFVTVNAARALAVTAYIMGKSPLKNQAWKSSACEIIPSGKGYSVKTKLKLEDSTVATWEGHGLSPVLMKATETFVSTRTPLQWVEVEVKWADGRRAFAKIEKP
ncbi:MAG: hypothetical protein JWN25_128, partial [Verrucomicrobiales bacterium]|nr:hypothetical protein [Verrucomicrobiales bacterium]